MSNAQVINDLIMKCAEYKKDVEYLAGERDYWKQQAQRNNSVAGWCDTKTQARAWLDRQAAITRAEQRNAELECETASWKANYRHVMKQRDKLQEKVGELEDKYAELEERHCEWSDPNSLGDGCMLRRDMTVDALRAENAELREKLSQAIGHAHDTIKLVNLDGECV